MAYHFCQDKFAFSFCFFIEDRSTEVFSSYLYRCMFVYILRSFRFQPLFSSLELLDLPVKKLNLIFYKYFMKQR